MSVINRKNKIWSGTEWIEVMFPTTGELVTLDDGSVLDDKIMTIETTLNSLGTMSREDKNNYELVAKKDSNIPQFPVSGNYVETQAIKSYVDNLISNISTQFFFYSFAYGQFAAGAPAIPSGVVLVAGDDLYNFTDKKRYLWSGVQWNDYSSSIDKTLIDGSTAIIGKMFIDGTSKGYPGVAIYEINSLTGNRWHAFPETAYLPDGVTLEFTSTGAIGIKQSIINKIDQIEQDLAFESSVKVINLVSGAATVDYEIKPFERYAFIRTSGIGNNISVTDSTGVAKASTIMSVNNGGNYQAIPFVNTGVCIIAFWNGNEWIIVSGLYTSIATSMMSNDSFAASAKLLLTTYNELLELSSPQEINLVNGMATYNGVIVPGKDYIFTRDDHDTRIAVQDDVSLKDGDTVALDGSGHPASLFKPQPTVKFKAFFLGRSWYLSSGVWSNILTPQFVQKLDSIIYWYGVDSFPSINNLNIYKNLITVSRSSNDSFSINSISLNDAAFCILLNATANISISIPTTSPYVNMSESSYSLANGQRIEIHGFKVSSTGNYHIKVLTK